MKKLILIGATLVALLLTPFSPSFAQSGPSDPDAIDYSALNNTVYTYADLKQAKARDLSDTQVAKIAKIARLSGMPFGDIVNAIVIQGKTFVTLADEYGIPLSDLDHLQKEKDEIANYQSAYETTGTYAIKPVMPSYATPGGMSGSAMSPPMRPYRAVSRRRCTVHHRSNHRRRRGPQPVGIEASTPPRASRRAAVSRSARYPRRAGDRRGKVSRSCALCGTSRRSCAHARPCPG